jgi:hypothetical protein
MMISSNRAGAFARTHVELSLPGGLKFTLTLRGRGFELNKVTPTLR